MYSLVLVVNSVASEEPSYHILTLISSLEPFKTFEVGGLMVDTTFYILFCFGPRLELSRAKIS